MKLSDFDFDLPEAFIAQKPLEERTASKLFVLDKNTGKKKHLSVTDLPNILTSNDVLVFNKSRVIPARLTGDFGEIFLSKPMENNIWQCLVKPGRKFKIGRTHEMPEGVQAEVLDVNEDGTRDIQFRKKCHPGLDPGSSQKSEFAESEHNTLLDSHFRGNDDQAWFQSWLQKYGTIPQPPYVKQEIENPERYQTTFSGEEGKSVAAPTAGLHFTADLLDELKLKGIETHFVHLDVGLGTFLPVKTENVLDHTMHAESFFLTEETAEALNNAKQNGKRIIAVGTTSIRVLESCSNDSGELVADSGETNIFIYPGYRFKFVDAMFTNFHTPKSTLLILVSAFAGSKDLILESYEEAKQNNYRFYSFGDAMLIE